jgi:diacylglycerol kinase (ATP)
LDRAIRTLQRQGAVVELVPTTGPGAATAIAREQLAKGVELVIAAGGDGTINEVAEGMVHSRVPLAILPGGTANVMAMEMKLGLDLARLAAQLHELQPRRIPLGHLLCDQGRVSRHFLLMAGIGLDAHIVYRVDAAIKARTGKLAYWLAGWSLLGKPLAQLEARVGEQSYTCSFALVSKVRNYGGDFEIAQSVRLFDSHFEVVLFEGRSTLPYVKYFLSMALRKLDGIEGVTTLRADRVVLPSTGDERVFVQIDGEFAGRLPAEITIVPDALTLLVPERYGE